MSAPGPHLEAPCLERALEEQRHLGAVGRAPPPLRLQVAHAGCRVHRRVAWRQGRERRTCMRHCGTWMAPALLPCMLLWQTVGIKTKKGVGAQLTFSAVQPRSRAAAAAAVRAAQGARRIVDVRCRHGAVLGRQACLGQSLRGGGRGRQAGRAALGRSRQHGWPCPQAHPAGRQRPRNRGR